MTAEDTKHTLEQLIHTHMPSAAVASGWASPVDPAAWVAWVSRLFPYVDRPEPTGLTGLIAWLESKGLRAGREYAKALHHDWILCALAVESRRHPEAVYIHASPRGR